MLARVGFKALHRAPSSLAHRQSVSPDTTEDPKFNSSGGHKCSVYSCISQAVNPVPWWLGLIPWWEFDSPLGQWQSDDVPVAEMVQALA